MVPEMQGQLLEALVDFTGERRSVADPFLG